MLSRFTLIILFFIAQLSLFAQDAFITTWKTDNFGSTADDQIQITTGFTGNDFTVEWSEVGNPSNSGIEENLEGNPIITFPNPGTYQIEITGNLGRFFFNTSGDAAKLLSLEQWGTTSWFSLSSAFRGCTNMQYNATDAPDLSGVTNISQIFYLCSQMTNPDLTNWDVSTITNMQGAFYLASDFNGNISNWNVSNVTNFSFMLGRTDEFAGDLSGWVVSNGENFEGMFVGALAFNSNISGWNTQSATNMNTMFKEAESFNRDLNGWDVDQVTDFSEMFRAINGVSTFNGDIRNWDVSSGEDFSDMFRDAIDFNQDLSSWTVSNATTMEGMFFQALSFNQDLSGWNISNVSSFANTFNFTDLSICNYNSILSTWSQLPLLQENISFGASEVRYSKEAMNERQSLIDSRGWDISDGGDGSIDIDADINDLNVNITLNGGTSPYNYSWTGPNSFSSIDQNITGAEPGIYTLNVNDFENCTSSTEEFILRESSTAFITTWKTDNPGSSNDNQIQINTNTITNNFDVYWEEIGNPDNNGLEQNLTGDPIITFTNPGTYKIEINGDFPRIFFNNTSDKDKILSIEQWGDIEWETMAFAFYGCSNLTSNATDTPNLTITTTLVRMFARTTSFNNDLSNWNVSNVTDMSLMFQDAVSFNNDISSWNVSNVTNMKGMFSGASEFNRDLGNWDVAAVKDMGGMFLNASSFDQSLAEWDISSVVPEGESEGEGEGEGEGTEGEPAGMELMLNNAGLSIANYDATLLAWATLSVEETQIPESLILDAINLNFCASEDARNELINIAGWTINDAGFGCPEPADQASNIVFSNISTTQMDVSWTNGNGSNRIVIAKENSEVNATPSDFITYEANPSFGSGVEIETDNFVVYNGNSNSFTINTLKEGTTYHFQVFEYNGESGEEFYNITTAIGNPNAQLTSLGEPSISSFTPSSAVKGDTVTIFGVNFTDVSLVSFGGTEAASFKVISDTEIKAVVGSGTSGEILVSTSVGTASISDFVFLEPDIAVFLSDDISTPLDQSEEASFGTVLQGEILETHFTIENTGTADLLITNISSTNDDFEVSNTPELINPDSIGQFTLKFDPKELGIFESVITISNNTSNIPEFTFSVSAESIEINVIDNETDSIIISEQNIDLGSTFINVDIDKNFSIENLSSNSTLEVQSIVVDNPVFQIINIPSSIAPSSLEEFTVRLLARTEGEYQGEVTITTDLNEFSFQVTGSVLPEVSTKLKVFNVVTPNGDGRHDFLQIDNITEYPNNIVSIFNRWGNKIFEVNNYNNNDNIFEGISDNGKELLTGNYYYVIDKGNGDKRISGFLLLKR